MSRDLSPDEQVLDLAGYHRGHARGYLEGLAAGKAERLPPRDALDVEALARAMQATPHGAGWTGLYGNRIEWRYLTDQQRAMALADAAAILRAAQSKEPTDG